MRVVFLYYANSWQETALRLIAAKLKAATLVEGDLVSGLAEMDTEGDNLMDALMEAISRERSQTPDWSGMAVARLAGTGEPARVCPCGEAGAYISQDSIQRVDRLDEAGCAAQV